MSWGSVAAGVLGPQQHRRQERAAFRVGADDVEVVGIADDDLRRAGQFGQVLPDVVALRQPDQRAHGDAVRGGVADPDLVRDPGPDGVDDVGHQGVRHQGAADRGAFLPGLGGHLGDQLPDVQVELRRPGRDIDAEHGEVQRIRLGAEPHAALHHRAMRAQQRCRRGGPGEGDGVLLGQQVEQAPRSAGDQLQAALGEQPGVDDLLHHRFGQVGRLRRGLHHGRHPGQERRRQLLQHAPDREVEGVDLQRDTAARGVDVLADELPAPAETFCRAVDEHGGVGQFPAALAGIA